MRATTRDCPYKIFGAFNLLGTDQSRHLKYQMPIFAKIVRQPKNK
jgi:hypothetical protein